MEFCPCSVHCAPASGHVCCVLPFLLCAELMFNGCFHGLDKHQLLALVSCLVPCDKSTEEVRLLTWWKGVGWFRELGGSGVCSWRQWCKWQVDISCTSNMQQGEPCVQSAVKPASIETRNVSRRAQCTMADSASMFHVVCCMSRFTTCCVAVCRSCSPRSWQNPSSSCR